MSIKANELRIGNAINYNTSMTQEQFLQILPAYMGCSFTRIGRESPATLDESRILLIINSIKIGVDFKLILRSFDQMTDEEKRTYNNYVTNAKLMGYAGNFEDHIESISKCINYLRSIGVDCDGLIEAGWAIKEGEQ